MLVNKDTEVPELVKERFNKLKGRFGFLLRLTDFPELLKTLAPEEFNEIDYMNDWTPQFVSHLIDLQLIFNGGGNIDTTVIHQDVVKVFHLSKIKKQRLVDDNFDESLWAIFLAVSKPNQLKL